MPSSAPAVLASPSPCPFEIDDELAALESLTVGQLRQKFTAAFGESTNSRHKSWLIKRIAWRLQANQEGGLSERARQRALELANDADLRVTAPRRHGLSPDAPARTISVAKKVCTNRQLLPGVTLQREYKGRTVLVRVLETGFEWGGQRYKSLTAVAEAVTGKHWNGFHFFGLRQNRTKQ